MSGTIVDSKQQTVPGATVVATHVPTGTKYSTATRADGRYNLPNLRVGGPYTIKVTFIGYAEFTQGDISLTLGEDYKLNATLSDNTVALKEVQVTGTQNKIINNNRTGARETITRAQIDRLPTINRSLQDFTKLTPSANGNSFGGRSSSYNNVTVDGALLNNSFGLSGTLGGQTNSQPISLDAVEQVQVDIAPFDVRQGFFTGAGVNTVTKSGTNEVKGSAYYYFRTPKVYGLKAGNTEVVKPTFTFNNRGIAVGGPIVKNKLFFFLNGEQERFEQPATSFVASRDGATPGGNVSQAQAAQLDKLRNFLIGTYKYDPGPYENYTYKTQSDKITAKLDWNIDANNTLSAKYFYLKSSRELPASNSGSIGGSSGTRQPNATTLPFKGSGYQINNNFNIGIVELNTRIGSKYANKATLGYSALRDFRASLGGSLFPLVDIGNAVGLNQPATSVTLTTFGYEPFTAFNQLNTDTWQFADDFTIYSGKHEITIGTSNQYNKFLNGFAPTYYGNYNFNSLEDFYASANDGNTGGVANATRYQLRYSALPDGSFPFAIIKAYTFSLYAQDKFQVNDRFRLTYGLRADMPYFPTKLDKNQDLANLSFRDGQHIDVSQLPGTKILLSPRVGLNYDVYGDHTTQLRGGAGIFTGQVPFVYISNQASNNGVQFGSIDLSQANAANDPRLVFNPDVNKNRPANAAANTAYNVAVTDKNFKYPQIFRVNAAVDQKLPFGVIGTLEALYSKDINAVYHQNINLPSDGVAFEGSDNRIRYNASRINSKGTSLAEPNISDAILMKNTSKGYSYFITGQLQKTFTSGFYASAAYTYSKAKSVNDGGSIAQSIWRDRPVSGDPNADELGFTNFYQPNRVILAVAYRKEYAKNYATSVGMTFEVAPNNNTATFGAAYSYTYRNDMNNDGLSGNDLMYIPKDINDVVLVPDAATDTRTPAQLWAQLNNFINQDSYLSANRGKVAERNGGLLPYYKQVNLNFTQDFFVNVHGKRNTIQLSANMINVGNFLNKNWGLYRVLVSGANQPLSYKGKNAEGKPTFSVPYQDARNLVPYTNTYQIDAGQFSRWQVQFGVRYIFN
ncbi:carboxypeptidase regulatory-like domain-containing protein [Mucilaginibacter gynuensis]|uniref:Carboxypeptidase regulatory-like domain-containing protein n=2 Tax=Mucilaginibacter gynuensis TaxID=1302236 RepID=A0ABP8FYT3_9SPHI